MFQTIDRLKRKPEHHRKRIAFGLATLVTGLIFVVWLSVIPSATREQVAAENVEEKNGESPFATMKNGVAAAFTALRKALSGGSDAVDLQGEYERIRSQVESGELRVSPAAPR